jgi:hypothetical protein
LQLDKINHRALLALAIVLLAGSAGFTGSHGKGHRQSDEERNP